MVAYSVAILLLELTFLLRGCGGVCWFPVKLGCVRLFSTCVFCIGPLISVSSRFLIFPPTAPVFLSFLPFVYFFSSIFFLLWSGNFKVYCSPSAHPIGSTLSLFVFITSWISDAFCSILFVNATAMFSLRTSKRFRPTLPDRMIREATRCRPGVSVRWYGPVWLIRRTLSWILRLIRFEVGVLLFRVLDAPGWKQNLNFLLKHGSRWPSLFWFPFYISLKKNGRC